MEGRGGGSTYFISAALEQNKNGILYTIECDRDFYNSATSLYSTEFTNLQPYIKFYFGESSIIYPDILKMMHHVDVVFLDGKEDGNQTVKEYKMFLPYLKSGSHLIMHDWNTEKMEKLKPLLLVDKIWKEVIIINDTPTGFAIFKKGM